MPRSQSQYVASKSPREVEVAFRLLDWTDGTPVGVTVAVVLPSGEPLGAMALQTTAKQSWQYFARVPLVADLAPDASVGVTITVFAGEGPPTVTMLPAATAA